MILGIENSGEGLVGCKKKRNLGFRRIGGIGFGGGEGGGGEVASGPPYYTFLNRTAPI